MNIYISYSLILILHLFFINDAFTPKNLYISPYTYKRSIYNTLCNSPTQITEGNCKRIISQFNDNYYENENEKYIRYNCVFIQPIVKDVFDKYSYICQNIVKEIIDECDENIKIVDLCCGLGTMTPNDAIGVDNNKYIIQLAKKNNVKNLERKQFKVGNAETWGDACKFDLVTCMFGLHEMTQETRIKVLENCIRISTKRIIIIDIDPSYVPNKRMISEKPYLLEYIQHIDEQMKL